MRQQRRLHSPTDPIPPTKEPTTFHEAAVRPGLAPCQAGAGAEQCQRHPPGAEGPPAPSGGSAGSRSSPQSKHPPRQLPPPDPPAPGRRGGARPRVPWLLRHGVGPLPRASGCRSSGHSPPGRPWGWRPEGGGEAASALDVNSSARNCPSPASTGPGLPRTGDKGQPQPGLPSRCPGSPDPRGSPGEVEPSWVPGRGRARRGGSRWTGPHGAPGVAGLNHSEHLRDPPPAAGGPAGRYHGDPRGGAAGLNHRGPDGGRDPGTHTPGGRAGSGPAADGDTRGNRPGSPVEGAGVPVLAARYLLPRPGPPRRPPG